jgi:perosamine synthetase
MIPVAEPSLSQEDIARANDCFATGWISSAGKYIEEFEQRWAAYCGMPHGVAVSNGSVALDVAIRLLSLNPGDEVIMPSFTIISCAQAITAVGGIPVLVDSELTAWQMDVSQIEKKITPRTKAIMVVHIYGHPVDMDPVLEICKKYNLALIEDAAEVHGARYKGRVCGSFGDIVTFSFFANKLITTGEGGMLLLKNEELARKARAQRNLCFQPKRRFLHDELGNNFRLTNVQAALGVGQVARIEEIVDKKRGIAHRYKELLGEIPGVQQHGEMPWAKNVYWVYGILLDERYGSDCRPVMEELAQRGVETRPFFLGMHEQPVFKKMGLFTDGATYPNAERLARFGFYIPSGLTMTDEQIVYVAKSLTQALESKKVEK